MHNLTLVKSGPLPGRPGGVFGFELAVQAHPQQPSRPVVATVVEGGPADSILKTDDVLTALNGLSVLGRTEDYIEGILSTVPASGQLCVVLARNSPERGQENDRSQNSSGAAAVETREHTIVLKLPLLRRLKRSGYEFGANLIGGATPSDSKKPLLVGRVDLDSRAGRAGLCTDDIVHSINGKSTQAMSRHHAVELIGKCRGDITLVIQRST